MTTTTIRSTRCTECGGDLRPGRVEQTTTVAGHVFAGELEGMVCTRDPSHTLVAQAELRRWELAVASSLTRSGEASGEALRYARKVAGLGAEDFSALLGRPRETLARWERGEEPIDPAAWALVGTLVEDQRAGKTITLDLLRAARSPHPLGGRVHVE